MAWVAVTNNTTWEYDNNPTSPGVSSPYYDLWSEQTNGIRTHGAHSVYTKCRIVGTTVDTAGELSKSYWDAHP